MATLKFILRPSCRGDHRPGKLCARLIHSRKVRVITLDISLLTKEWDEERQVLVEWEDSNPRSKYLKTASEKLDYYRSQFEDSIRLLEDKGRYDVSDIILDAPLSRGLSTLQGYVTNLSRHLERSGQGRTARAYQTSCRALITFNKGKDLPLNHINHYLIKEFEYHLKSSGRAMNTISYYMRMLRAIYRKAQKDKLIKYTSENPFDGIFTGFEETRKRALDLDQLRQLYQLDFSDLLNEDPKVPLPASVDKGLYDSWRYFFFCFHARGMSFVDMAYLRKANIRHGVISYYRKKTGKKIEISLTPSLQRIIDSFSTEVKFSPYLFPIIRDLEKSPRLQYENGLSLQNKRLKKLAKLAGIAHPRDLTTHVSRHSWATTGKRQNLPLSIISEGLGHRSERTTYTYLASFDQSTLDQASRAIDLALLDHPALKPSEGL